MTTLCRYAAFKTTAEKKAVLSDYQAEKGREVREEKRRMDKLRRDQFSEMIRTKEGQVCFASTLCFLLQLLLWCCRLPPSLLAGCSEPRASVQLLGKDQSTVCADYNKMHTPPPARTLLPAACPLHAHCCLLHAHCYLLHAHVLPPAADKYCCARRLTQTQRGRQHKKHSSLTHGTRPSQMTGFGKIFSMTTCVR